MNKKISVNIKKGANFVREKNSHQKLYVIDEVEYSRFKSIDFKNPVLNINCQVLDYEEKENEIIYTFKNPPTFLLLPSSEIEVVAMNP